VRKAAIVAGVFGAILCGVALNVGAQAPSVAESATLNRILARDAIYIGFREAAQPFSFQPKGQQLPAGYTWEICTHVVKVVQERLGKPVKTVPVSITENSRVMMVKTGVADLDCGAISNSVARQKQAAFSYTVYVSEQRALVRKDSGLQGFDQLSGKRVVVVAGGYAERYLKQAALGRNISVQLLLANEATEAMALLTKGEADAYVGDDATLAVQRATRGEEYVLLTGSLAVEPYAIMLPKDDPVFKKLIDDTLVSLMQSGELERIYDKWFMNPIPPSDTALNLPMSPLLKAAIQTPNDKPVN
jgi:glutamate/aspartate transport system substrate-binding protein